MPLLKTNFPGQENYIEFHPNKKPQRTIYRLRISSHRLGIETGRHQKPTVSPELRLNTVNQKL